MLVSVWQVQLLQLLNFRSFSNTQKLRKELFCWLLINSLNTPIMTVSNISKITELTIYESPDGGRTVYARRPGSNHRELHLKDPELEKELADMKQQERWQFILAERKNNSELNHICEQAELLYELTKKPR